MAEICCGLVSESETSPPGESSSRAARRRRMEIRRFKFVTGASPPPPDNGMGNGPKRLKFELRSGASSVSRDWEIAVENCSSEEDKRSAAKTMPIPELSISAMGSGPPFTSDLGRAVAGSPKFGVSSVCGRRRDMEDAVAIRPSFCWSDGVTTTDLHYYGVYDGHGCSHVRVIVLVFCFRIYF